MPRSTGTKLRLSPSWGSGKQYIWKVRSLPETVDVIETLKLACPQHPFPNLKNGRMYFAIVTRAPWSWAKTELISFCTEVSGPALAVAPQSSKPKLDGMLVAAVD